MKQSYDGGLFNNLEQLSHIAIVSFYKGTTIQFSALSYELRQREDLDNQNKINKSKPDLLGNSILERKDLN